MRTQPVADRSIVFLALTGAESGLLGPQYYVENPVFPLRRNRGRAQFGHPAQRRTDARS